jgi:hypothetical protein
MLEEFQAELDARGITLVRVKQANVLALGQFPSSWSDYDLIVCTSMLEYLARADFSQALSSLRGRLVQNGTFLAVVTRRNWITKILIERCGTRQGTRAKNFGKLLRPPGSMTSSSSNFLSGTSG